MKCSDISSDLSIYCDGFLSESEAATVGAHLESCPLCRQRVADFNEIRSSLRHLRRPDISDKLRLDIKIAARTQLNNGTVSSTSSQAMEWIQMRLMPYAVGVFASITIGSVLLTIMLSGMLRPASVTVTTTAGNTTYMLAGNDPKYGGSTSEISPVDFSRSRMAFSSESPSLNPKGALVAITDSILRGEMKDEEVVVVAEVFGNGVARISEVVESPRDTRSVSEIEKAFESASGSAPFVPAVMENRPENMMIVMKFHSVDVPITRSAATRKRS